MECCEKRVRDVRASYQHKLDDLRGQIRGSLTGRCARQMETAKEAAAANRMDIVLERLDAMEMMIADLLKAAEPPK